MGRAFQKAMRGAATVAVPALLNEHQARIQTMRETRLQSYQTQARQDSQEFQAGENQKNRDHQMEMLQIKGEQAASKPGAEGKVPEYEKVLRKMSAETFNSSLGDSFNFEGDNADKAAQLAQRSVEIYKTMEKPDTTVAYNKALKELRNLESQENANEDALSKAEQEAEERDGFFGDGFGNLTKEQWTQKRHRELSGGESPKNFFDQFDNQSL